MSKARVIIAGLVVVFLAYAGLSATVVKEGHEAELTGEKAFDPTQVAKDFWAEKSKDYFEKNAVELNTLLKEADGDFTKVASKYGYYSMGDKGELSFIVKGSGKITEVKNKLRSGYFAFDLTDTPSEDVKTRIQIGPVFKGSAVRDSISLISYDDYTNQIEWAQVSVAFHELIVRDVLSKINFDEVTGKDFDFLGCFTVKPGAIAITPVELTVK